MEFKICTKCGAKKETSEFRKSKKGKFGVMSVCKNFISEIEK